MHRGLEMEKKIEMLFIASIILITMLAVGGTILAVKIGNLNLKLADAEQQIELLKAHSASLDEHFSELNEEVYEKWSALDTRITENKAVLRNTNHALTRLNKSVRSEDEEKAESSSEEAQQATHEARGQYLGVYELTAYEYTGSPCANGNMPTVGYTVACNSLPLGTRIYIEGYGEYVVEDRGGMSGGVIDVYLGDAGACIQFGRRSANVYLVD